MKTVIKSITVFTIPCLLELIFLSMLSLVSLAMVGSIGAEAISAVGLTAQPLNISLAIFQAFNVGATAIFAGSFGAKKYNYSKEILNQTIQLAIVMGLIIAIPAHLFSKEIVWIMGASEDSVKLAKTYMEFMAIGLPFQIITLALTSLYRGAGNSKLPMVMNISANIINAFLGYLFIFGKLGFPEMGVYGAGLASLLAKITSTLIGFTGLKTIGFDIFLDRKDFFSFKKGIIKKIVSIGSASAIEQFILRFGFFLYTRTVADLGTIVFAAHQICLNISNLSTNFGHAIGMASTSFTGRLLGAGNVKESKLYINTLFKIGLIISLFIIISFLFWGEPIIGLYTSDIEITEILLPVFIVLAIISPAQNSLLVYSGAFKGAGDTKWPLLTTLVGLIGIRLPLVYLLVKVFPMGLMGAWIATAAEKYIALFFYMIRYKTSSIRVRNR